MRVCSQLKIQIKDIELDIEAHEEHAENYTLLNNKM